MSKEEQIRKFGLKAQFWPDFGPEEPEGLYFGFEIVDKLPKDWLKVAKRLTCWAFINKKKFNTFQIVGFDELEGGRVTVCPLKILVTLNDTGYTNQILVLDGSQSYLLLKGQSASNLSFMLKILYYEDFEMYDSRVTYDVIESSVKEEDLPPFDVEESRKNIRKRIENMDKKRERRNLSEMKR